MSREISTKKRERIAMLRRRVVELTRDPEMSVADIARRLGCSHVTVRRYQREAGVYRPAPNSAERKAS